MTTKFVLVINEARTGKFACQQRVVFIGDGEACPERLAVPPRLASCASESHCAHKGVANTKFFT